MSKRLRPGSRPAQTDIGVSDFVYLWLHVLSLAAYFGATLAVMLFVLPATRAEGDPAAGRRLLVAVLRRYDPFVITVLGVLIMTGAFRLTSYKAALQGLFFRQLGTLLAWKLGLTFALVMVAVYSVFGLGHRLVRSADWDEPFDPEKEAGIRRRLSQALALALLLAAATTVLGLKMVRSGVAESSLHGSADEAAQSPGALREGFVEHQRSGTEFEGSSTMEVFKNAQALAAFAPGKMKKVNLFETERMFCDVYGLEPGQEQSAHAHAGSDKVYYVLEGRGRFRIDAEERELGSGHAVFAPAGSSHAVINPGPDRLALLVFMAPKPS